MAEAVADSTPEPVQPTPSAIGQLDEDWNAMVERFLEARLLRGFVCISLASAAARGCLVVSVESQMHLPADVPSQSLSTKVLDGSCGEVSSRNSENSNIFSSDNQICQFFI